MRSLNQNYTILSDLSTSNLIQSYLNEVFPNPVCELNYNNLFELLICVMLSAQTLDKRVNEVTPILFNKYDTIMKLSLAQEEDLIEILKPLGLAKVKAKNLILISKIIYHDYNEEIPTSMEELTKLPGVGEKTAQVVLIEGLNIPAFPVDTHVLRVSKRLGLIKEDLTANQASKILKEIFPIENWAILHKQMVLFGRYLCKAKKPECLNCKLKNICNYK